LAQREAQPLPSPPRFAVLQERRLRRAQRQRGLMLLALVGVLVGVRTLQRREPLLDIRAELAAQQPTRSHAAAAGSTSLGHAPSSTGTAASPAPSAESPAPTPLKVLAPRPSRPSLARAEEPNPPPAEAVVAPASEGSSSGGAVACAQLARVGASEQALACYAQLASGAGMSAELALFEQARLEGKALRQPDRALRTLDDYRRRFPDGSLRGEVMLAQIDWLLAAGNSAGALRIVDEALASGLLLERADELARLRATLSGSPHE